MKRIALVIVLGLAAVACGAAAEPTSSSDDFDGEWKFVRGRSADGAIPLVDDYDITLEIKGNAISGTAACNSYDGTATIDGTSFSGADFSMTEMGCNRRVMIAESRYVDALVAADTIERNGDALHIFGRHVDLRYSLEPPPPDAPLEGTRWNLESIFLGRSEGIAMSAHPAQLELDSDGTMRGTTGCRSFEGHRLMNSRTVLVSDFETGGDCIEGDRDQDEHVIAVIHSSFTTTIEGQSLTIYENGGDTGLGYITGKR